MTTSFKTRFWQACKWFALVFVLLFIFRLTYGYVANSQNASVDDNSSDFFSSLENVRKNYASEKFATKVGDVQTQSNMASNQKFEKTASIKTKTSEFEKDDIKVKAKTKAFNAIIQYEQNLGQKGDRQIHLLIGVNPLLFDSFYVEMQKVGVIKATQITKVDKTNEYRQLNAKKTSLQKNLLSLQELKNKGGAISDYISLNDKILEIEEKLQDLGVELGNFDTENEFCTVKLSLYEGATEKNISLFHRIKVALEWSIKYFALLMVGFLLCLSAVFVLLLTIDKLNLIKSIFTKISE